MPQPIVAPAQVSPFVYRGGVKLREACWVDGKPWFTRRAIGMWLGYRHPDIKVAELLKRHPYIQAGPWRRLPILGSVEGSRQVVRQLEVFDPVGLQLITFESHTKKALKYKVAVANLVWAYLNGEIKPKRSLPRPDWEERVLELAEIPAMPDPKERGAAVKYMMEKLGCSQRTVYRKLRLVKCGLGDPLKPIKGGHRGSRMAAGHRKVIEQALRDDPRTPPARLRAILSGERLPHKRTVRRFKNEFLAREARLNVERRLEAAKELH